jgi:N,N-dimethylformamidase
MRRLSAYADRISARPGESVEVKVSADEGVASYRADLVRLWCLDDHRDGPGLQAEGVACDFAGSYAARMQPVRIGSAMVVRHPALADLAHFGLSLWVWPTLRTATPQTLAATDRFRLELVDGMAVSHLRPDDPDASDTSRAAMD